MSEPTNTNYIENLQLQEEHLSEIERENKRLKEQNKRQNELIDSLRIMYAKGGQAVSETPISDSTPHNVADLGMLCRRFERFAAGRQAYITQLESENDAMRADLLLWNEKEVKP